VLWIGTHCRKDYYKLGYTQFGGLEVIKNIYIKSPGLSTISDDVIIVTSSLTKDMTGKEDSYRAAAIRLAVISLASIEINID
jgi:hypothetical protein